MAPQLISDPIWAHMAQNTPFDPFSPPEHSWQDGPSNLTLGRLKWPITLISDPFWHYGPKRVKKGHFGPFWALRGHSGIPLLSGVAGSNLPGAVEWPWRGQKGGLGGVVLDTSQTPF